LLVIIAEKMGWTANPLQTPAIFGVGMGLLVNGVDEGNAVMIAMGIGSIFNLIFPVYLKLMMGFPSLQPENVGADLLHKFGFGHWGLDNFERGNPRAVKRA
jgi:hypothetical protein